jgi:hypothetical protein
MSSRQLIQHVVKHKLQPFLINQQSWPEAIARMTPCPAYVIAEMLDMMGCCHWTAAPKHNQQDHIASSWIPASIDVINTETLLLLWKCKSGIGPKR